MIVDWQPIETIPTKYKHNYETVLLWAYTDGDPQQRCQALLASCVDHVAGKWLDREDYIDIIPTHWAPWPPEGPAKI